MNYTCATMPLSLFIRCTVHGDLSPLGPTEEAQKACWLAINSEYCELLDDKDQKRMIAKHLTGLQLYARIVRITMLVAAMRIQYDERIKAELDKEDFGRSFDPSDPDQYADDLEFVLVRLKEDEIDLMHLEASMEADGKQKKENKRITELHFDEMLMEIYTNLIHAAIGDIEQIKEQMKVHTFALYLKRLRKYYSQPKPALF